MPLKINDKAGIRATFKARPDLKKVYVLPSGDHFFTLAYAEQALEEGEKVTTLTPGSEELQAGAKEQPKA